MMLMMPKIMKIRMSIYKENESDKAMRMSEFFFHIEYFLYEMELDRY